MFFIALLIGCGGEAVPPAPIQPTVEAVVAPSEAERATTAVPSLKPSAADPVQIVLVWEGVARLHKGFFSEPEIVRQLGRDLAGHVKPPVNVYISFDSNRHIGRILVRLLPKTGIGLWTSEGKGVDLTSLSPVFQALGRYRTSVAARFDRSDKAGP